MSTTVNWHIANLERELKDGYVYTVHYTVDANNETYSSSAYGSLGLERPDKLIPFKDLTEKNVIDWVKDTLGDEKVQEIETALLDRLSEQANPTRSAGLPWA